MIPKKETAPRIELDILDTAANELGTRGQVEVTLKQQAAKTITDSVLSQLLSRFNNIVQIDSAPVTEVIFKISERDGVPIMITDLKAKVTKPISTDLHVRINFKNSETDEGKLILSGLTATPAIIEGAIKKATQSPEVLFSNAIRDQMQHRHVELTNASFSITPDSLAIGLAGQPIVF